MALHNIINLHMCHFVVLVLCSSANIVTAAPFKPSYSDQNTDLQLHFSIPIRSPEDAGINPYNYAFDGGNAEEVGILRGPKQIKFGSVYPDLDEMRNTRQIKFGSVYPDLDEMRNTRQIKFGSVYPDFDEMRNTRQIKFGSVYPDLEEMRNTRQIKFGSVYPDLEEIRDARQLKFRSLDSKNSIDKYKSSVEKMKKRQVREAMKSVINPLQDANGVYAWIPEGNHIQLDRRQIKFESIEPNYLDSWSGGFGRFPRDINWRTTVPNVNQQQMKFQSINDDDDNNQLHSIWW